MTHFPTTQDILHGNAMWPVLNGRALVAPPDGRRVGAAEQRRSCVHLHGSRARLARRVLRNRAAGDRGVEELSPGRRRPDVH